MEGLRAPLVQVLEDNRDLDLQKRGDRVTLGERLTTRVIELLGEGMVSATLSGTPRQITEPPTGL